MEMSRPEVWLIIVLAALVTLAERASFLIAKRQTPLPPLMRRALRYVPAAVFAAIAVPAIARPGLVAFGPFDVRLIAAVAAAFIAWKTRNVTLTFVIGMAVLWALTWLAPALAGRV